MGRLDEYEDNIHTGSQYIIAPGVEEYPLDFDPWATFPKWDVDTACKAITLSRMIDIDETRRISQLEFQVKALENPEYARHICRVYDRARLLADNAIKIGVINELDTPINWIKWAALNRYDVSHLKFIMDPDAMETFKQRLDEYVHIELPLTLSINTPLQTSQQISSNPKDEDADYDNKIAALFDPVPLEVLETMFKSDRWQGWANRASQNKLIKARPSRGQYNPYLAGMWFVKKGIDGWDLARCYRVLANNLPKRSLDHKHLLTGNFE